MRRWAWLAVALLALPAAAAGDLRPFLRGSWRELRQAHAGHPTIVHLWGLTCAPCLAELPRWADLQHARRDLDLVLIAADSAVEDTTRISTMLAQTGLSASESWAFADRFVDRLRFEIDPRWHGELPRSLLIAADGTIETVSGVADLAAIRAWLDRQGAHRAE